VTATLNAQLVRKKETQHDITQMKHPSSTCEYLNPSHNNSALGPFQHPRMQRRMRKIWAFFPPFFHILYITSAPYFLFVYLHPPTQHLRVVGPLLSVVHGGTRRGLSYSSSAEWPAFLFPHNSHPISQSRTKLSILFRFSSLLVPNSVSSERFAVFLPQPRPETDA